MTAQWYLSRMLEDAYASSSEIQQALGSWSLGWYVANGASGHNYGTDVDVGVCDAGGNPLPMPSSFDAFDDSGHLTAYQMSPDAISPDAYADSVKGNEACLALHRAFVDAGFSELASEWWHFADGATESVNRAVVGGGGLDFVATL